MFNEPIKHKNLPLLPLEVFVKYQVLQIYCLNNSSKRPCHRDAWRLTKWYLTLYTCSYQYFA